MRAARADCNSSICRPRTGALDVRCHRRPSGRASRSRKAGRRVCDRGRHRASRPRASAPVDRGGPARRARAGRDRPMGEREPLTGRIEAANITADLDARHYSAPELRYQLGRRAGRGEPGGRTDRRGTGRGRAGHARAHGPARADGGPRHAAAGSSRTPTRPAKSSSKRLSATGRASPCAISWRSSTTRALRAALERDAGPPGHPCASICAADRLVLDDYLPATLSRQHRTVAAARPAASKDRLRALDVRGRLAVGRLRARGHGAVERRRHASRCARARSRSTRCARRVFGGTSQTALKYDLARGHSAPDARAASRRRRHGGVARAARR